MLFDTDYAKISKYTDNLDGKKFTAKDFRTVRANQLAIHIIKGIPQPQNEAQYKSSVKTVGERVSSVLGNRLQQALASYIDSSVFADWQARIQFHEKEETL